LLSNKKPRRSREARRAASGEKPQQNLQLLRPPGLVYSPLSIVARQLQDFLGLRYHPNVNTVSFYFTVLPMMHDAQHIAPRPVTSAGSPSILGSQCPE